MTRNESRGEKEGRRDGRSIPLGESASLFCRATVHSPRLASGHGDRDRRRLKSEDDRGFSSDCAFIVPYRQASLRQ